MRGTAIKTLWTAGAIALASLAPHGAAAKEFYEGKALTLFAGYPVGGGVDNEMRLVAQFLGKFIPGNPTIIAKNMPGAGGMVLGNYLFAKAAPDGLTLGMPGRSGFLLANAVGEKSAQFDLKKFTYIGTAISTNSILWMRRETGIKTLDDLKKAKKEIVIGGLNSRSQNVVVPKILAKYQGFPFRTVHGYPGFHAALVALERGEVDGVLTHEGSIQGTRPDLITSGKVTAIFQTFPMEPNLPLMDGFVTDKRQRDLLRLLNAPSRIGLPTLGPPAMNAEATKILRAAFKAMVADKTFRETADKRGMSVTTPASGEELQAYIEENLGSVPDDVVKEYLSYTERPKKKKKKKSAE